MGPEHIGPKTAGCHCSLSLSLSFYLSESLALAAALVRATWPTDHNTMSVGQDEDTQDSQTQHDDWMELLMLGSDWSTETKVLGLVNLMW